MADVVADVEGRVIDPKRTTGLAGWECELLSVARNELQARLNLFGELLERGRFSLNDNHRPDVHVRVRSLLREERRVNCCKSVKVLLCHLSACI